MVQFNESQKWSASEVQALFDLPFSELLYQAQTVHRQHFSPNEVQKSRLVNIKTGGCPEDCKYCSQSIRYATEVQPSKLMSVEAVIADAKSAKADGASRYCMGAAWRGPKDRHMDQLCQMIGEVKALGMETCMTLGLLDRDQAIQLKQAGLDYYNHNVDTSPEYYDKIITTRTFEDRLQTIGYVREAGMKVCCGGILGMGETQQDRGSMLRAHWLTWKSRRKVYQSICWYQFLVHRLKGRIRLSLLNLYVQLRWPESCCQNQCFGFQQVDGPCLKNFRRCVSLLGQIPFLLATVC